MEDIHLHIKFDQQQREKFRNGSLVSEWSSRYGELFDEKDVELAISQPKYHFFEWLCAIVIYEATGYLSLLENYTALSHPRKLDVFKQSVPEDVFQYCMNNQSGLPDLFCFHKDTGQWFFCEVKGGPDKVRSNQDTRMKALHMLTGKSVFIMNLSEVRIE